MSQRKQRAFKRFKSNKPEIVRDLRRVWFAEKFSDFTGDSPLLGIGLSFAKQTASTSLSLNLACWYFVIGFEVGRKWTDTLQQQ